MLKVHKKERGRASLLHWMPAIDLMNEHFTKKEEETADRSIYRKIDNIENYLDSTPYNARIMAEKNGYITGRRAEPGEKISVMTSDGQKEVQETAKEGDWIATRAYEDGTNYVDKNGNTNSWLMSEETLAKKYEGGYAQGDDTLLFKPRGQKQEFMRVSENVALTVPWGENGAPVTQYVKEGGWLNITDLNDVHGIAEKEFTETYDIVRTLRRQEPVWDKPALKGAEETRVYQEGNDYAEKVNRSIAENIWEKALDHARSAGVEFSDPKLESAGYEDPGSMIGTAVLKNGIEMRAVINADGKQAVQPSGLNYKDPKTGEKLFCHMSLPRRAHRTNLLDSAKALENLKVASYESYLENAADRHFPEQKEEVMARAKESGLIDMMDNTYFDNGDKYNVFYENEPDRYTAAVILDAADKMSDILNAEKEANDRTMALKDMPHNTQAERVAVLKEAAGIFRCINESQQDVYYDGYEDDQDRARQEGMETTVSDLSYARYEMSEHGDFDIDATFDKIHDVTNEVTNELFAQLSADTQGVTHDEVQKNFGKYEIPGLDSVQYLTDNGSTHYDLVQLTLSDEQYFNADVMRIPSELIDNLPSAMSAAAKYSQTQAEFEAEMTNGTSYEEAYHNNPEENDPEYITYKECTTAFELLGEARYDTDIKSVMYEAANIDNIDYDSYMHAVKVLDNAGVEGLQAEVKEREMSNQEEWEENEQEEPDYDELVL